MYFCWGREGREMHAEKRGAMVAAAAAATATALEIILFFSFFSCPISIEVIYCGMDVHLKTRLLPDIKLPPFNIYLIFDELYTTSNWCIPGSPPPPPPPIKESKSISKKV